MKKTGFSQWLLNYKEFGALKASNVVARLNSLSDAVCTLNNDHTVFENEKYSDLVKWRMRAQEVISFSSTEKKDIDLFADYLQMIELTHLTYEVDEKSALETYCETMKMSYSYKPVLILSILNAREAGKKGSYNEAVEEFVLFYRKRIGEGLIAEKKESIFATEITDYSGAKSVIENNPIAALKKAGIVQFSPADNYLDVTSEYMFETKDVEDIKRACNKRLTEYYNRLCSMHDENKEDSYERLRSLLLRVEPIELRNECLKAYEEIYKERGFISEQDTKAKTFERLRILESDDRKIGKLVRETIKELADSGFTFSDSQYADYLTLEWSKRVLGIYYPLFRILDPGIPVDKQIKDSRGNARYYRQIYDFGGVQVLMTSEWYKESKQKYIKWFNDVISGR